MNEKSALPRAIAVKPPGRPPEGALSVPGAKSLANRALLLAGAASGESRLSGLPGSDDVRAAVAALESLGVAVRRRGGEAIISGRGIDFPVRKGDVPVGSSGTVGRFLPGLLAAAPAGNWRLIASPQLSARPIRPLLDALRQWGAGLEAEEADRAFPLQVAGGGLSGGDLAVSAAASSQFASGVLLAAPFCRRPARIVIRDLDPDEVYIDMTLDLMRRFGAGAEAEAEGGETVVRIDAPRPYRPADFAVEADANTAAYFLSLAAVAGGCVTVTNLNPRSRQPGVRFLDVLARLGCGVETVGGGVAARGGPLPLRGGFALDMRAMAEMAVTLGILAVFADAPIRMANLAHIRGHESDRLAALAALLGLAGVRTEESPDGITVHPAGREALRPFRIDPRNDHRLAMSFALLGAAGAGVVIDNPGCVAKTCPGFFDLLAGLGVSVELLP
ncbi:MAG: 3-phosphoshikimate 1-carboxyvinyltransferase [Planctomycetota bacterium]|jgi:3-phosphoshikimate 1-carboxyvinyltransferase|nr:3-phosphoshikimate 1-carboxyvinyltransferase [Planctomycetota bacterium]